MKKSLKLLVLSFIILALSSFMVLNAQSETKVIKPKKEKKELSIKQSSSLKYKNFAKYKASKLFYISKRKRLKLV